MNDKNVVEKKKKGRKKEEERNATSRTVWGPKSIQRQWEQNQE